MTPRTILTLVRHMFSKNRKHWSKVLERYLEGVEGTEAELDFVSALARQGQREFSSKFAGARIEHWGREW